jgi:hypothetical protein
MQFKTLHQHARLARFPGWVTLRRRATVRPGEAAPQPRVWSLLLPPRYPTDRR